MLSLEPATITNRSYPELFQTGETAYGKPLVDEQHPHNFIMGLGVHYAHSISETRSSSCISRPWAIPRSARWRIRIALRPRKFRKRRSRTIGRIQRTSPTKW
jgi:hypothetical protein